MKVSPHILTISILLGLTAHSSLANLLIDESFDYSAGAIGGVATNALGLSGSYVTGGSTGNGSNATFNVSATSLSFAGHFASSGGSLQLSNPGGNFGEASANAQVSAVLGGFSTIYMSSIQTMNTADTYYDDWVLEQRFNSDLSGAYQTSSGRNQVVSYGSGAASNRKGGVSTNGNEVNQAIGTLNAGTNYLLVTRYSILGTDVTAATLYAFDETAYAAYLANSNADNADANLATYALFSLTDTDSAPLSGFNFLQFTIQGGPSGSMDEFRVGTAIGDVVNLTAVPEPSSLALLGIGLLGGMLAVHTRKGRSRE
jgi:hypothetical protein